MLKVVDVAPLSFEQIVVDVMALKLAGEGFALRSTSPLYKNRLVTFSRERKGQLERVRFGRRVYSEDAIQSSTLEDEVDRAPMMPDGEIHWMSRHFLSIQILVNSGNSNLLRSGTVGTTLEEVWWYFEDEDGLRRLLLEEVSPPLLTAGMESFDDALEARTNPKGHERVLQENVA
jgi:hypothetical protein